MNVLVTGAYGRCGTALIDHLDGSSEYEFTYLNRSDRPSSHPYGDYDTYVADVSDYDAIRPAFEEQDAVIHLAAYPYTDGTWEDVFEPNIVGTYNTLKAARDAGVESVVFGSTNHVMGLYERDHAPALYRRDYDFRLEAADPVRPDSYYGTTKVFGEALGRYFAESSGAPERFYALRICTLLPKAYDNPYGAAEQCVDEGECERGSEEYERLVARTMATWHSRRDFAHQIDCCLQDDAVEFDIFHGVSDNDRRWFSLQRARDQLGYAPQDNAEDWNDLPPDQIRGPQSE